MRAKILSILLLSILFAAEQANACPFCYGAKDGKSTEHMAVAIWFLFGAVMSVVGLWAESVHLVLVFGATAGCRSNRIKS